MTERAPRPNPPTSESTESEPGEPNIWAQRSYDWGIYTWVGNLAGCFIGLVPIALPLGIALTVATLFTGFASFGCGWMGLERARGEDHGASRWRAWVGIGLSTAHLLIVVAVALLAYFAIGELPEISL